MISPRGLVSYLRDCLQVVSEELDPGVIQLLISRIQSRELRLGAEEALSVLGQREPPLSKPYPSNAFQCGMCLGTGRNGACRQCWGNGWVTAARLARRCGKCKRKMLPHQWDCEHCPEIREDVMRPRRTRRYRKDPSEH